MHTFNLYSLFWFWLKCYIRIKMLKWHADKLTWNTVAFQRNPTPSAGISTPSHKMTRLLLGFSPNITNKFNVIYFGRVTYELCKYYTVGDTESNRNFTYWPFGPGRDIGVLAWYLFHQCHQFESEIWQWSIMHPLCSYETGAKLGGLCPPVPGLSLKPPLLIVRINA